MLVSDMISDAALERVVEEHEAFLFPAVKPYYRDPLVLRRGSGVWVSAADGREYLDCFSGILTLSLGHCHPEVNARVVEQMSQLGHTSTLYVTENQIEVGRKLAELAPGELNRTFFTNSGTEAVETAVMAACLYTGRSEVIALRHAYHGRSLLATSITANASWRPLAGRVTGIHHVRAPYVYRSEYHLGDEEAAADGFAADLEEVIATAAGGKPAALIAEPILGVGGYIVPPRGYYERAAEIIRKHGGLFISDEVQTGFGRTGRWWGIDHWNVEPDIMIMAKGIANGYPAAATMARGPVAEAWTPKTLSTYGGNPISMAATAATLDVMVRENVPARSAIRGEQLEAGLERLRDEHSWIGEVRGLGLMQGIELVRTRDGKEPDAARASALLEATRSEGLLVGLAGVHGNVVRIAPSMLIAEDEMDEALGRFARACRRVDGVD